MRKINLAFSVMHLGNNVYTAEFILPVEIRQYSEEFDQPKYQILSLGDSFRWCENGFCGVNTIFLVNIVFGNLCMFGCQKSTKLFLCSICQLTVSINSYIFTATGHIRLRGLRKKQKEILLSNLVCFLFPYEAAFSWLRCRLLIARRYNKFGSFPVHLVCALALLGNHWGSCKKLRI